MAAENVDSLFMTLGLNLADLESGFVAADRTVRENIQRLNRENNLIRLRGEVQIAGLDETADAERILQIRQDALNQQMSIQRDRVRLLDAEFRRLAATHGTTNAAVQRAEVRLERERLALANLERESRRLNDTTGESNGIFDELSNMLPEIPTKFQAIGLAAGAVATGIGAASTAVQDLLEQFRELQNQSYELNMSVPDTRDFLRRVKLGGGDIGDFEGYIRGITDAYVKGEYDDPEFIALRKYGAEITDATGRLKDFKDITEEVYQAWKKADEAGEGIEFLQLTGGEAGVRDAIQLFRRYEEAKEDAAKIFTVEVDERQLHQLDRTMNMVDEQSAELKNAIGDIFAPAAQAAAEKFFEVLHDGTQTLAENKDEIQRWGFIVAETFSTVSEKVGEASSAIGDYLNEAVKLSQNKSTGNAITDRTLENMSWRYGGAAQDNFKPWANFAEASQSYGALNGIIKRAEDNQRAYNKALSDTKTVSDSVTKGLAAMSDRLKDKNPLSQYAINRVNQFRQELEDLQVELDFGDNDYAKAIAELNLRNKREGALKLFLSDDEAAVLDELYKVQKKLIDQERDDKITDELRPQNYEERLKLIEREKQKLIEAGVEEAEAYARAQDTINEKFTTSLEERIAKIEDEKQAWIQAGMDRAEAEGTAQERINKAREEAAEKIQEHYQNAADIQFNATHTAFEKELHDIERWQEEQRKKAETAEEVAGIVAEAAAKESAAFEREVERVKNLAQSFEDKIFAQENSQYAVDRRKLEQEVAQAYKDGVPRETLERYYNNKLREINQRAAKGGDYTKAPTGANSGFQLVDYTQPQQQIIGTFTKENTARQSVINSLTAEQRQRLEQAGVLDKIIAAQNSLVTSTEKAADNLQDAANEAASIEIIHGDQIGGQDFSPAETPTIDDLLEQFGNALPTDKLQDLTTQAQAVTSAQGDLGESTKNLAAENLQLADTTEKVKIALKNLSEDNVKKSSAREDTDVPLKSVTKSAPLGNAEQNPPREKVQLQTAPKDKSFLTLSDIGFDYDTAKDIFLTGAGMAAASGATGVGLALSPEILAGAIIAAIGGGVVKGTYDNRDERLNAPDKISLDDGTLANIDLSEISSPLSNLDTNVQGIRDILQGNNAVEDANAEGLESTSENSSWSELLTPLNSLDENVQSIWQKLQGERGGEQSAEQPAEISSEVATQIADSVTAPIKQLAQELQAQQATPTDAATEKSADDQSHLATIDSKVQSILERVQATTPESVTPETKAGATEISFNELLDPLKKIDGNVQSIFQEMQSAKPETTEQPTAETPEVNFSELLSPLGTIRDDVAAIWADMQSRREVSETSTSIDAATEQASVPQQENIREIFGQVIANVNSPLSDIVSAIANKQIELPPIELPVETIVQPIDSIGSMVSKIVDLLSNREPPKVEISPSMDIDLGGAYVFDDRLKSELVNDITSNIVSKITEAVERATASISRSGGYGFGS